MRAIPTSRELTRSRATQLRHMPGSVQVLRRTVVISDMGEEIETFPSVATVACRLLSIPRMMPEGVLGSRMTSVSSYTVIMPHDTLLLPKDRLLFEGRTLHITRPYNVTTKTNLRVVVEEHD